MGRDLSSVVGMCSVIVFPSRVPGDTDAFVDTKSTTNRNGRDTSSSPVNDTATKASPSGVVTFRGRLACEMERLLIRYVLVRSGRCRGGLGTRALTERESGVADSRGHLVRQLTVVVDRY